MRNQYWYFVPNHMYPNTSYRYSYPTSNQSYNDYANINQTGDINFFNLGDKAPDFTLEGIVDGEPKNVSLSDYLGKWVVVFFYGSNFTFV